MPSWIIFDNNKKDKEEFIVYLALTLASGIVLNVIVFLFLKIIGLNMLFMWSIPIISLIYIIIYKRKYSEEILLFKKIKLYPALLYLTFIIFGITVQVMVLIHGGTKISDGIFLPGDNDALWNLALVKEIYFHYPFQNPLYAGQDLKNYHYFYHLFLASIHSVTKIDFLDLYYRGGPILMSFLFGLSIYSVSSIFVKNRMFRILSIFLGYFSGNFAYILPLFLGRDFNWRFNSFFSDQPLDQIINTQSLVGYCMFLISAYLIYKYSKKENNKGYSNLVITVLVISFAFAFKSFSGLIITVSLSLLTISYFLIWKSRLFIPLLLFSVLTFLPLYFYLTETNVVSFHWAPGWILTETITNSDKLNRPEFAQIEAYYNSIGNFLGLLKIKTIEFIIYFFGNLGMRIIGLVYLIWLVIKRDNVSKNPVLMYLIFAFLVSFSIPVLFNLGGTAHNITQFTPYALLISTIFSVAVTEKIYFYFTKRHKRVLGIICVICVIALTIPVTVKELNGRFILPKATISQSEMEGLDFIKKNTNIDEIILTNPKQFGKLDARYVSALSERRIFFTPNSVTNWSGNADNSRAVITNNFFSPGKKSPDILRKNNISYIYLIREELNPKEIILPIVFKNNEVTIYKL